MTEKKQPRVIIVGAHCGGKELAAIAKALDTDKLELIDSDIEIQKAMDYVPKKPSIPIEDIKLIESVKTFPETRAERRAKARKKRKR